ncbi:uncharacterized protein LAESUDRAFT_694467 [Laetiporus sulphureus 93-53]|uniref:Transcription factor BYE1 n=1 Tax=Laetiporus sulphureus 93-53 TaxID=1314785 RepID=A0A165G7P2_9APHY|nr:uncharacterized protein LAESUDRAFT_694467 [Laetiporus sulphureus 93-53]KZT09941.1 hypothetical protein LAESUDRAFT_694467 [Laetiporus sulphureus 93-53]
MTSRTTVYARQGQVNQADEPQDKENKRINDTKLKTKPRPRTASKASKVHCLCRKPDDGSPMIRCDECKGWYHFRCVGLKESDAEDIQLYICPPCAERTGLRSIKEWEGVDGLEEVKAAGKPLRVQAPSEQAEEAEGSESGTELRPPSSGSESDGSEDEYIAEETRARSRGKRRVRRVSVSSSGSESEKSTKGGRASKKARRLSTTAHDATGRSSTSPGPSNPPKRRQSTAFSQPPAKRVRSESGEDPTRKYCLTKLQETFCQIFLRYPFLRDGASQLATSNEALEADRRQEELTDDQKEKIETTAKHFASDLEQCVYDLYAEPDKAGKRSAAGKYKERFRMLTFNLSKPDRVLLHKRIASSHITPKELSTMSSTDLADEETKQSIKQAEQEALDHSILKKQTLPRAKITHKGIENIEDVNGAVQRDIERAREEEEEERIERERLARLQLQAERARSASILGQGSVPPESPVVPQPPGWGGPPALPTYAIHPDSHVGRPPSNALFVPSVSDYGGPVENELNLADLINIDEDLPVDTSAALPISTESAELTESDSKADLQKSPVSETPTSVSSTAISPFASRSSQPELASRPSFDLNSIWIGNKEAEVASEQLKNAAEEEPVAEGEPKEQALDVEILGQAADDYDFDMFLGKDDDEKAPAVDNSPEGQRAAFEALPRVWIGTLSMPLDSAIPQNVSLNARQTGGRTLEGDSPLWHTLFPSSELRIDGRVPVDKSAQYLTQMRLNPSKELIAVAFSPEPGPSLESPGFNALIDHLIAKGRHGLVFPWGNRPKEWAPGRELYIIPLLSTDPVPEYMELLDDLRLPKLRNSSYLIGVWVLNKGRLAPPPRPPAPPAAASSHPAPPTYQLPQILSVTGIQQPGVFNQPSLSPASQPPQPQQQPQLPAQQTSPAAALAAEVAQLTPEQIQAMLRTLASSALIPQQPAAAPPASAPSPMPAIFQQPSAEQAIPLQPWLNPSSSFSPPYQGAPPFPSSSPPRPSRSYSDVSYGGYDQERPYPPGHGSGERGDRGYRGRSSGRNRGGRGRDRDRDRERTRDSGWGKRGRGRGGAGSSSPTRGRGWGEQQRWS